MISRQPLFRIKSVDARRAAVHEEEDDAFCRRREMRRLRSQRISGLIERATESLGTEERRKTARTEAETGRAQPGAARDRRILAMIESGDRIHPYYFTSSIEINEIVGRHQHP